MYEGMGGMSPNAATEKMMKLVCGTSANLLSVGLMIICTLEKCKVNIFFSFVFV